MNAPHRFLPHHIPPQPAGPLILARFKRPLPPTVRGHNSAGWPNPPAYTGTPESQRKASEELARRYGYADKPAPF